MPILLVLLGAVAMAGVFVLFYLAVAASYLASALWSLLT